MDAAPDSPKVQKRSSGDHEELEHDIDSSEASGADDDDYIKRRKRVKYDNGQEELCLDLPKKIENKKSSLGSSSSSSSSASSSASDLSATPNESKSNENLDFVSDSENGPGPVIDESDVATSATKSKRARTNKGSSKLKTDLDDSV